MFGYLLSLLLLIQVKPIDLNRASLDELLTLPIGYEDADSILKVVKAKRPSITREDILERYKIPKWKALRILGYREEYGPFQSFYELLNVRGVNPGDLARWRYLVVVRPVREGVEFSMNVERVRERSASEESPRESAFDEWITRLDYPIILNKKVSVDELYQLNRVSLIDAVAVVRRARGAGFRGMWDLRRTPGLSHYGYLNMRPFVRVGKPIKKPVGGWIHLSTSYSSLLYEPGSELYDRIDQLTSPDTTLSSKLFNAGWDSSQVDTLESRLTRLRDEVNNLRLIPKVRMKGNLFLSGNFRSGFLYQKDPYNWDRPILKGFFGVERKGLIERFYLGNYRLTIGQALMMDNTDEVRDRLIYRPQGLFGDLTSTREFTLFGAALQLNWKGFNPLFYYSKNSRDGIPKSDKSPNFYYVGAYVPKDYRDLFKEEVLGASLRYNPPSPFPIGTQFAFNFLQVKPDRELIPDFELLDIPGDRDSLRGDPSFYWVSKKTKRFWGFDFRAVEIPFSLEGEVAKEVGGGSAFVLKGRYQIEIAYIDFLFRHYDANYTNPYMRPFQEDSRFEDTPLERPYRLLNPLDSELSSFPLPKPETGLYIETRFQPLRQWLFPRVYLDVWRDNTDGLLNFRFQGEIEFRPVFPVRVRFRQKFQNRLNLRGLMTTRSFLDERNFRVYYLLPNRDYIGLESRFARVFLTSRPSYPETEIRGGFVSLRFDHSFSERFKVKIGSIVWRTNGLSQWGFEDTGIDFFYGNGSKLFVTLLERLSPRVSLKLKFRYKNTIFPHWGLSEAEAHTEDGKPVYGFSQREPLYSLLFVLDYGF